MQKTAKQQWDEAVQAKIDKGMSPAKAAAQVNRERPGLRQRMLTEYNTERGRTANVR